MQMLEVVDRIALKNHLNSKLLLCFRQFIAAVINRTNPIHAPAPDAIGVDTTLVPVFQNEGWCPICEERITFTARYSWFRDHYLCDRCGSIPRERALMHVIQTRYPSWRDLAVHESSPGNRGASVKLSQECRSYTASQYDPQLGFGKTHPNGGYRSENLEKQTFPDEAFDLVVTQDVFEHIFDARAAFIEIARTLKPGGAHIFTTPLVNKKKPSEKVASVSDAGIVYHHPAEYHGNPMSAEGALVTWHWGEDIVTHIKDASGLDTEVVALDDLKMGIRAEFIEVLVTTRPSSLV
jgi:Methyltransferase domain